MTDFDAQQHLKESLQYLTKGTEGLEKGLNAIKEQLPNLNKEDKEAIERQMKDFDVDGMTTELKSKLKQIKRGYARMDRRG